MKYGFMILMFWITWFLDVFLCLVIFLRWVYKVWEWSMIFYGKVAWGEVFSHWQLLWCRYSIFIFSLLAEMIFSQWATFWNFNKFQFFSRLAKKIPVFNLIFYKIELKIYNFFSLTGTSVQVFNLFFSQWAEMKSS